MKKLLLIGSVSLLLGACGTESSADPSKPTAAEAVENTEENTIEEFIDYPLTTTFEAETIEIVNLTEEEQAVYDDISHRINSEENMNMTDREYMESIADDYPDYTPHELAEFWFKASESLMYSEFGDTAITGMDQNAVVEEAISTNVTADNMVMTGGYSDWNADLSITKNDWEYTIDGKEYSITVYLEYSEDYRTAELIRFVVNGEEIAV